ENRWSEIESYAVNHNYYRYASDGQARRRAAMATILTLPLDVRKKLSVDWNKIFDRLTALLEFLDEQGFFVLRRGTIEDYYRDAKVSPDKKITEAIKEANYLLEQSQEFIESHYADLLRVLNFAYKVPEINETSKLTDIVLRVASPIVARLTEI